MVVAPTCPSLLLAASPPSARQRQVLAALNQAKTGPRDRRFRAGLALASHALRNQWLPRHFTQFRRPPSHWRFRPHSPLPCFSIGLRSRASAQRQRAWARLQGRQGDGAGMHWTSSLCHFRQDGRLARAGGCRQSIPSSHLSWGIKRRVPILPFLFLFSPSSTAPRVKATHSFVFFLFLF